MYQIMNDKHNQSMTILKRHGSRISTSYWRHVPRNETLPTQKKPGCDLELVLKSNHINP